jgi:glycosyltransferase involved in cell wall biosynthesis
MHVLFVHQNYPAQFGHIAAHLSARHGWKCTFATTVPPGTAAGVERIQYKVQGGATQKNHYCSRTFENAIWHTHGVFEALKARRDVRPDLIVGHSGFGSTLFLRELYDCPIVNFFEYFYRPTGSDMDFRPDFPSTELNRLRARARNAMLLLDLENCDVGYAPTVWQRSRLPEIFHPKVRVIFDGVDQSVWKRTPDAPRILGKTMIPDDVRIVTYVSRGMESMRGFDVFMKTANEICKRRKDVVFAVVGDDRVCYGGDEHVTGTKSFKQWVLSQDSYDLSRFHFLGLLPPDQLARIFSISDLHIYLTVPFVLSWSLMNALSCGAVVLASRTPPVEEMIQEGKNGLLCDFFDVAGMADKAEAVLDDLPGHRRLGESGTAMIQEKYGMDVCLPQFLKLYEDAHSVYKNRGR